MIKINNNKIFAMKNTTLTFLVLLFGITTNIFSQEASPVSKSKKIQIGANFSTDYCYRTLQENYNNNNILSNKLMISLRNKTENYKISYTSGLNVVYNLNRTIGIEAGIQFSNKGYQTKSQTLTYGDMIDTNGGFINSTAEIYTNAYFVYNDYYIDIPLKANFIFGKKKIRLITSAGITTNIFIIESTTSVLTKGDGSTKTVKQSGTYNYNSINLSPTISLGIDWRISNRHSLRVEPTFRYGILKIIDAPITGYLWNAGLNVSYYFGL
ncbi:MAG: outer membrane beta-barrel protein [Bacteroidota bacterium]